MICKDSDAFALEKYMDELLDFTNWKNTNQIAHDLHDINLNAYSSLIDSRINTFTDSTVNYSAADFIDNAMRKLCFLFPMKYEFCSTQTDSMDSTSLSEEDDTINMPQKSYMYKRKLGFTSII